MPSLPKKAVVNADTGALTIDGVDFPWYITESGVEIAGLGDRNTIPTLTFAIFAETVEVIPKGDPNC